MFFIWAAWLTCKTAPTRNSSLFQTIQAFIVTAKLHFHSRTSQDELILDEKQSLQACSRGRNLKRAPSLKMYKMHNHNFTDAMKSFTEIRWSSTPFGRFLEVPNPLNKFPNIFTPSSNFKISHFFFGVKYFYNCWNNIHVLTLQILIGQYWQTTVSSIWLLEFTSASIRVSCGTVCPVQHHSLTSNSPLQLYIVSPSSCLLTVVVIDPSLPSSSLYLEIRRMSI